MANPLSATPPAPAAASEPAGRGNRPKGSAISGVTGLRVNDGKRISGVFLHETDGEFWSGCTKAGGWGTRGLTALRFLRPPRRSWSLKDGFLGPTAGFLAEAGEVVDPVSIWTTCLKEAASAWTKVEHGLGLGDTDKDEEVAAEAGVAPIAAAPLLLSNMAALFVKLSEKTTEDFKSKHRETTMQLELREKGGDFEYNSLETTVSLYKSHIPFVILLKKVMVSPLIAGKLLAQWTLCHP